MATDPPEVWAPDEAAALAPDRSRLDPSASAAFLSDWRRLRLLLLLSLASCATMYGRAALGPLQEAIRVGLSLSDNQIAVLQGPAIALPSLLAAIPVGFIVDRYSRRRILVALGLLNALSGLLTAIASTFLLLFVARCAAGLATTAMAITVYSVVAEIYAPAQRGRAMTLVTIAEIFGPGLAFLSGGLLLELCGRGPSGWRGAMAWITAPLIPAAFALLGVREPPRSKVTSSDPEPRGSWSEVWALKRVLVPLLSAAAAIQVSDGAALTWTAPVLSRDFGVSPARIGAVLASAVMIAGVAGPFLGGLTADLSQRLGGPRVTFLLMGLLAILSAPAGFFAVVHGLLSATCLLVFFVSVGFAISVMGSALLTVMVPQQVRGLCMSLLVACNVLAGVGLAPMVVSGFSGLLGGAGMVGHVLSAVCSMTSILGAIAFACGAAAPAYAPKVRYV